MTQSQPSLSPMRSRTLLWRSALPLLLTALLFSCTGPSDAESTSTGSTSTEETPEIFSVQALIFESDTPLNIAPDAAARAAQGETQMLLPGEGSLTQRLVESEAAGRVRVLSAPSILTEAGGFTFQTGTQLPIQTVTSDGRAVQFVNATLRLEGQVTSRDDEISLRLEIQRRSPIEGTGEPGGPGASIRTTEASYATRLSNGGTAVLHGLFDTAGRDTRGPELVAFITIVRQD